MSVPGSAEGSTRKRPSFAFWDRQRKTSTNTSFVPPLKAAEERNRDALSASPVRRREDLDESSTGWGGISSIVSLDQEVAERERKSFERRAQEYDIASGGTGFDSMMTQNPSKGAARSSLPLQHFDHFSLPDFTSSAASSVSANSSWTSDRASSLDPPSRRDPELAPGPSRGGLDGASMIRSQSGSVLTSPSRTEVPSHRHSREASSSSSLPRAASKDLGRQYQYDEAQETTTEGEGDSDAATYTRDAARSRRRRQMLRESLRKRTKKRGGLGNQGAKPAQARGESGSDGSSSAWDSGDDEQSDSEDVEEGQSFTPGGRRLRQSRQGGESDPSQSSRRQSIGNSLSGTPKKPGRSGAGDAVNEELVAPSSQEDAVETFFDAPTQKHSETDDLGGTSFLPSPLIPSAGTMTPNRSHSPSNDWVTSSKNASHKLNDPSSSSTLRQDAAKLAVLGHSDRSQGTNHHLPTQNESHGYRTPTASLSVANPLATHSFIPSLSSTDTPSGAARSSSSPYSPLGIPSSPTSSLRNLRSGPLPPPRPSPTAPLPPPPNHSDEAGGSPDSPARGPNPAFLSPRVLTSIGEARSRVRSQSLGQASEALQRTGRSRTQESTITASNDAIARTSSPAAPRESRSASFDGDGPHSRKAYAALISESDSGGPRAASSSLGPSGTIRGRPRGATIGAVPSASAYMTSSGRISVQPKSRPRSLLCNEIVPALDARDTIAKLAPISGSPVPGMAASASSPSDLFGLGAISATSASANTSVSADSNARTISSSATSMSKASIQGSLEGSDEYEDQVSSTSNPRIGHHNNLEKSGGSSGGNVGGEGSSGRKALSSNRSRSGSNTSLLQQVRYPPKSYAAFVIAVVGHHSAGKSTVIKKGLRQFGLSKPNFLSDRGEISWTKPLLLEEQQADIIVAWLILTLSSLIPRPLPLTKPPWFLLT
ncbi:hypothetical protein IE53DRAFT_238698 [Violaceomyces palustris]|uniref:Uncharacterized protein n=1 Tax=Violaceomyces palustris TaxID=1673888 RepID=A0ACD0NPD9_9BASI|nr:hypothetical protein IE53DRAFT_238698 [Violaceomyces palustris]